MTLVKLLRDLRKTLREPGVLAASGARAAAINLLLSRLGHWLDRLPGKDDPERIPNDALNAARAKRGGRAVAAYQLTRNMDGEDKSTVLTDLLADLMHWGAASGIDVADALWSAQNHASAEGLKEVSP